MEKTHVPVKLIHSARSILILEIRDLYVYRSLRKSRERMYQKLSVRHKNEKSDNFLPDSALIVPCPLIWQVVGWYSTVKDGGRWCGKRAHMSFVCYTTTDIAAHSDTVMLFWAMNCCVTLSVCGLALSCCRIQPPCMDGTTTSASTWFSYTFAFTVWSNTTSRVLLLHVIPPHPWIEPPPQGLYC